MAITYDAEFGHVCTCQEKVVRDDRGEIVRATYTPTVQVARDVEPTNSGSYFYVCSKCGSGGWSGC